MEAMIPPIQRQQLDLYRLPARYHPGASLPVQLLWFCLGAPLLAARWLPGSVWRVWLLIAFGSGVGPGCRIKPGLRVKYPWRLNLGPHCWLGEDVWIDNLAPVLLADRVCVSQGAYFCTGNHNYRKADFGLRYGSITIGSGAWIGAQAVLAPGVQIGADAVVALAAVVLKDVPAAAVVRGNPAEPIGPRWPNQ